MKIIIGMLVVALFASCGSMESKSDIGPETIKDTAWNGNESTFWKAPESVFFNKGTDQLFVSNISGGGTVKDKDGWITLMSATGEVIKEKWITGLNGPKGMRASGDYLWVSDIDQVVSIRISTGKILKRYTIPNAKFLNDIAIDTNGTIYVSDTIGSAIYNRTRAGKEFKPFMTGAKLESPNGLYYKAGKLYVAAWGLTTDWSTKTPGKLYSINLKNKSMTNITKEPLGNLDGLEIDDNGQFLVSDWVSGKIFRVSPEGASVKLYEFPKGAADIAYIPGKNLIIVPQMQENKVTAVEN
jgi:sugar lactone lactonase YvrE